MTAQWLPRSGASGAAPLAGVRVLDLSELLPGPFLTQNLVELGAEVWKVERPPSGDPVRRTAPGLFAAMNRGKRSLLANLKDTAERSAVLALADEADVLVESFRPGVVDRLGLGWNALHARNPRLVMVSLSGYGTGGPREQWPGHDINYLAAAGVVALASTDAAPSPSFGVPMADLNAAMYALAALNAALLQRERSGLGQRIDVSITDCALHWMNARLPVLRHAGAHDPAAQRALAQQRPGYGVFRCRDGLWLSIGALEDHFWAALVRVLALDAYAASAFASYRQRLPHAAAINTAVAAALLQSDRGSAMQRLLDADVPAAEVALPDELPVQPQFVARALFVASDAGPLVRWPVPLAGMQAPGTSAPALDER